VFITGLVLVVVGWFVKYDIWCRSNEWRCICTTRERVPGVDMGISEWQWPKHIAHY
jgi:hypothetical protein